MPLYVFTVFTEVLSIWHECGKLYDMVCGIWHQHDYWEVPFDWQSDASGWLYLDERLFFPMLRRKRLHRTH